MVSKGVQAFQIKYLTLVCLQVFCIHLGCMKLPGEKTAPSCTCVKLCLFTSVCTDSTSSVCLFGRVARSSLCCLIVVKNGR